MNRLIFIIVLGAAASTGSLALADEAEPAARHAPTIEEAIDIAKRCVIERDIRVAGSFIESARYERNTRGERGPFWRVTWAHFRETKGGQVFVAVFSGGTCQVTYGE